MLRCLAGLIRPDRGAVFFDREKFLRERIDLRRRIHFLPDFPSLFPNFDGARQVWITLELYGKVVDGVEEAVASLFEKFDMLENDNTLSPVLSRGQAYKAGLIALLALDVELWLSNEPFASGMDPLGILGFNAREAAARGATIVYSTQIREVAKSLSDLVCMLHKGQLRACECIDSLRERMGSPNDVLLDLFQRLKQEED